MKEQTVKIELTKKELIMLQTLIYQERGQCIKFVQSKGDILDKTHIDDFCGHIANAVKSTLEKLSMGVKTLEKRKGNV